MYSRGEWVALSDHVYSRVTMCTLEGNGLLLSDHVFMCTRGEWVALSDHVFSE